MNPETENGFYCFNINAIMLWVTTSLLKKHVHQLYVSSSVQKVQSLWRGNWEMMPLEILYTLYRPLLPYFNPNLFYLFKYLFKGWLKQVIMLTFQPYKNRMVKNKTDSYYFLIVLWPCHILKLSSSIVWNICMTYSHGSAPFSYILCGLLLLPESLET